MAKRVVRVIRKHRPGDPTTIQQFGERESLPLLEEDTLEVLNKIREDREGIQSVNPEASFNADRKMYEEKSKVVKSAVRPSVRPIVKTPARSAFVIKADQGPAPTIIIPQKKVVEAESPPKTRVASPPKTRVASPPKVKTPSPPPKTRVVSPPKTRVVSPPKVKTPSPPPKVKTPSPPRTRAVSPPKVKTPSPPPKVKTPSPPPKVKTPSPPPKVKTPSPPRTRDASPPKVTAPTIKTAFKPKVIIAPTIKTMSPPKATVVPTTGFVQAPTINVAPPTVKATSPIRTKVSPSTTSPLRTKVLPSTTSPPKVTFAPAIKIASPSKKGPTIRVQEKATVKPIIKIKEKEPSPKPTIKVKPTITPLQKKQEETEEEEEPEEEELEEFVHQDPLTAVKITPPILTRKMIEGGIGLPQFSTTIPHVQTKLPIAVTKIVHGYTLEQKTIAEAEKIDIDRLFFTAGLIQKEDVDPYRHEELRKIAGKLHIPVSGGKEELTDRIINELRKMGKIE